MAKKQTYIMKTEKPSQMGEKEMEQLKNITIAPYMQIGTALIGKERRAGGNMFRHQIGTFGILIDYGYIDPILLKASVVHDVIEDIPDFDENLIINADSDGPEVHKLVLEVSKRKGESKDAFLKRIIATGSQRAKVLKCADRISNMIELGFVTDFDFMARTCEETEFFIFPIALEVDYNMFQELIALVRSRQECLRKAGYYGDDSKDD